MEVRMLQTSFISSFLTKKLGFAIFCLFSSLFSSGLANTAGAQTESGSCLMQIASRPTVDEVFQFVYDLNPSLLQFMQVWKAPNGWYAISIGEMEYARVGEKYIKVLKAQRLIPEDSFCNFKPDQYTKVWLGIEEIHAESGYPQFFDLIFEQNSSPTASDVDNGAKNAGSQKDTSIKYIAVLSCNIRGKHFRILSCLGNSQIKLRNHGRTQMIDTLTLLRSYPESSDGLQIELSEFFQIVVQNKGENPLALEIRIYDTAGNEVYQDMVGKFGVINVAND